MVNRIDNSQFKKLLKMISNDKGLDFSGYKPNTIKRRVARRISSAGSDSLSSYMDVLKESESEYTKLISDLTIKVSHFFRNPLVFELIYSHVLDDIFKQKENSNDDCIRIWCAGCAFGEEVYSMAITVKEYMDKESVIDKEVRIFGTDLDAESLKKAKKGVYSKMSMDNAKLGIIDQYFDVKGSSYYVNEKIREMVSFSTHNILSEDILVPQDSVFADFDIILCRNVLIYFSQETQDMVFDRMNKVLTPGGYMILGEADHFHNKKYYMDEIINKTRIFKKPE